MDKKIIITLDETERTDLLRLLSKMTLSSFETLEACNAARKLYIRLDRIRLEEENDAKD